MLALAPAALGEGLHECDHRWVEHDRWERPPVGTP